MKTILQHFCGKVTEKSNFYNEECPRKTRKAYKNVFCGGHSVSIILHPENRPNDQTPAGSTAVFFNALRDLSPMYRQILF